MMTLKYKIIYRYYTIGPWAHILLANIIIGLLIVFYPTTASCGILFDEYYHVKEKPLGATYHEKGLSFDDHARYLYFKKYVTPFNGKPFVFMRHVFFGFVPTKAPISHPEYYALPNSILMHLQRDQVDTISTRK